MTSYARKSRKQIYGDASGHARYGGGTRTHQTDVKSSRARNTVDLSAANLNKHYSRLDDDDVERAMNMPVPLSPTYQKTTDSSDSGSFKFFPHAVTSEHEMQQLPTKPSKSRRVSTNEKAMEVLGMGLSKVGVSTTKVVGGNKSTSSTPRKSGDNMGGIEVKRDIIITTTLRS